MGPKDMKSSLFDPGFYPIKAPIHGSCAFCFIVPLMYHVAVVLSVCKGAGGEDVPILTVLCEGQFLP
jgi:hypothetical protein